MGNLAFWKMASEVWLQACAGKVCTKEGVFWQKQLVKDNLLCEILLHKTEVILSGSLEGIRGLADYIFVTMRRLSNAWHTVCRNMQMAHLDMSHKMQEGGHKQRQNLQGLPSLLG